jgi:hypothetical protein
VLISSAFLLSHLQTSNALDSETVSANIAKHIVVRIDGKNSGSGVIIKRERESNTYTVLTNKHVVKQLGNYSIKTELDGRFHKATVIKHDVSSLDLALVEFVSDQDYKVAELDKEDTLVEGKIVYVVGYPNSLSGSNKQRTYKFTEGKVTGFPKGFGEGYSFAFDNRTNEGMSGGPVLNSKGRLIGIYGSLIGIEPKKRDPLAGADSLGIPITRFNEEDFILLANPIEDEPIPETKPSPLSLHQQPLTNQNVSLHCRQASRPQRFSQKFPSQNHQGISIRLFDFYVTRNNTYTAELSIENRSNKPFGFSPLSVQILDVNSDKVNAIVIPATGVILISPNNSLKTRLSVLWLCWNNSGTQNLLLRIREEKTGDRQIDVKF